MIPFNNDLQAGQPALIINVEYPENSNLIGKTVVVKYLLSIEESQDAIFGANGYAYACYIHADCSEHFIRQNYLMPLPPLGDVYNQEKMDELENMKIYN